MMAKVKSDGIGGQQAPHQFGQLRLRWEEQQVCVVCHKCPSQAFRYGFDEQLGETVEKYGPVAVIVEDIPLLYSSHHYVLKNSRYVYARGSWHTARIPERGKNSTSLATSPSGEHTAAPHGLR